MIVLGRITAPFGVAGWLRVHAFGDDPLAWRAMPQWWLADAPEAPENEWRALRQIGCKAHGDAILVRFEGVIDRTGAEALTGKFIAAPRDALPKTGKDEFYWVELIGLPVTNVEGESLGVVVDLIDTGVHSVLQLKDEAGVERLLPFTAQVVKDVKRGLGIEVEWGKDWGLD